MRHIRRADGGSRWFFQPARDASHEGITLWVHATPELLLHAEQMLRAGTVRHGGSLSVEYHPQRPSGVPDAPGPGVHEALARASSDLAVELLDATRVASPHDGLALAVRHLHLLTDLVPAGERPAFLFACWEHWSAPLDPAERVALNVTADPRTGGPAGRARGEAGDTPHEEALWRRYVSRTRRILAAPERADTAPANYLLFEHAHLTHRRMGIPAAVEASAARVVRARIRRAAGRTAPAAAAPTPA